DNAEAYQAYLKGCYFLNKRTPEAITKGIEYFRQAIETDPNYALAYAGLAEAYDKAFWYMGFPQATIVKEQEAATQALQLDASLAEAHLAMVNVYASRWDLPNAVREQERAIAINP